MPAPAYLHLDLGHTFRTACDGREFHRELTSDSTECRRQVMCPVCWRLAEH
jgi:hypothetical protein